MNPTQAINAIEAGNTTSKEIAEFVGLDFRYVGRELKNYCQDDSTPIDRTRPGREYVYHIEADDTQAQDEDDDVTVATDEDGLMTVHRDGPAYDWDLRIERNVPEYIEADGEWSMTEALMAARDTTGMCHFRLGGGTGCGKTHLARAKSAEHSIPLFTIQAKYALNEAKLLGSPSIAPDGTTVWVDGELTKAVMASRERPVILLIDEVNRARPDAKSVLFAALDDRCEVRLDGERGGELIQGKAENLIVISTMNEGDGHFVGELDVAEKRRLGMAFDAEYLGINNPEAEADLVTSRAPVGEELATMLVKTANEIRTLAREPGSVKMGMPTATVIEWADGAYAFDQQGIPNPVVESGVRIAKMFWKGDALEAVSQVIQMNLAGCPVGDSEAAEFKDGERVVHSCDDCGWKMNEADVHEDEIPECIEWGECPQCGYPNVETSRVSF